LHSGDFRRQGGKGGASIIKRKEYNLEPVLKSRSSYQGPNEKSSVESNPRKSERENRRGERKERPRWPLRICGKKRGNASRRDSRKNISRIPKGGGSRGLWGTSKEEKKKDRLGGGKDY